MANEFEGSHLGPHHRDTLAKILRHPVSHNVEWHDVVDLVKAAGTVDERHDGKFAFTIGSETEVFDRPHGKDVGEQQIVDLRRMLTGAGYSVDDSGN